MNLNEIAIFAKVVQAGSFTGASRRLSLPKSTVSAKVRALEERLGVSLLHRTTRKLSMTAEGQAFFNACAKGLADIEAAEATAASGGLYATGLIRVTAPIDMGMHFMPGFLQGFLQRHPGIEVDLIYTGRVIDIIDEGIDVAIRASALKDSTLMARKVATSEFNIFAAPSYLATAGRPKEPKDLAKHVSVRHSRTQSNAWELVSAKSAVSVRVPSRVTADELATVKEMVVAGLGVGLMPRFICAHEVSRGELVQLMPDWHAFRSSMFLVYPAQRFPHPKVKVFTDEVAAALKGFFV